MDIFNYSDRAFFFFFFFTVTKKKKKEKSRVPSIVRSFGMSPSRGGGGEGGKRKRKEKSSISFFRTNKSIVDTILFQSAIKFAMSSL